MLLNRERARKWMRESGVDALVATTPTNITYFSDYFPWPGNTMQRYMVRPGSDNQGNRGAFAVLPLDDEPALIVRSLFAADAAESWVKDFYPFGDPGFETSEESAPRERERRFCDMIASRPAADAVEALEAALKARRLSDAVIGIEMEGLAVDELEALRVRLPGAKLKNCSNLLRLVRMVKSPEELRRLRRAYEIAETAAQKALADARPGVRLLEVSHAFRTAVAGSGADVDHFAFGFGGCGISVNADYRLGEEDVLFIDFGCMFERYFSDSGVTYAWRPLPPALATRHQALQEAVAAGAAALRPGAKASEMPAIMRKELKIRGITHCFPHGHGIGLEVRDYPILVDATGVAIRDDCVESDSDLLLEADMVLNLEACMFLPGSGSLQVERSFLVTGDGARALSEQSTSVVGARL